MRRLYTMIKTATALGVLLGAVSAGALYARPVPVAPFWKSGELAGAFAYCSKYNTGLSV